MGHTFAEKALARNAGLPAVQTGQVIDVTPDVVLSHDNTAAIIRIFRELGMERVQHPERLAIALDHAVPAPTTQHARNHAEIRRFVAEQGIRFIKKQDSAAIFRSIEQFAQIFLGSPNIFADNLRQIDAIKIESQLVRDHFGGKCLTGAAFPCKQHADA